MIHHSPMPDVNDPRAPAHRVCPRGGAAQRDKPALIDGASGRVMTYGELEDAIRSLAGGLAAAGFGRGDVLALMAPNGPEYAVVFHGAAMAGGTRHDDQPGLHPGRGAPPARRSSCAAGPAEGQRGRGRLVMPVRSRSPAPSLYRSTAPAQVRVMII